MPNILCLRQQAIPQHGPVPHASTHPGQECPLVGHCWAACRAIEEPLQMFTSAPKVGHPGKASPPLSWTPLCPPYPELPNSLPTLPIKEGTPHGVLL